MEYKKTSPYWKAQAEILNKRFASLMKEEGYGNKLFSNLTEKERELLSKTMARRKRWPEGQRVWTDKKIKGKIYSISSSIDPEVTTKIINFFDKWKKDPTQDNFANLFAKMGGRRIGSGGTWEQRQITGFMSFLKGEELATDFGSRTIEQWNKIKNIVVSPKEQNILNKIDYVNHPIATGTNDQTAIVKYFRDNPTVSMKQALADLSKDPDVILRAENKHNGIINDFYLKDRITRTYQQAVRKQVIKSPTRYPALKDFTVGMLDAFGRTAYRLFPNSINRGIEGTILQAYGPRDSRRQFALDKLKAFKQMTRAFQDTKAFQKYRFGKPKARGTSVVQFDHPISFSSLEKGGSKALAGSLKVNPIQGDINQVKRILDQHLGVLRRRGIKGTEVTAQLHALQDINKTLFGERLAGTYDLTPTGRFKDIKFGAPEFIEANLLEEFEKNLGLGKDVKTNIRNIKEPMWKAAGIKDSRAIETGIKNLKKWNIGDVKGFLKGWVEKNPDQAEILSRSVGCGYSGGGRVGLQEGGNPFRCLTDKIDNKPNIVMRAIKRLPTGGKLGLLAGAVGAAAIGIGALFGGPGAKAEEPSITDDMTYNAKIRKPRRRPRRPKDHFKCDRGSSDRFRICRTSRSDWTWLHCQYSGGRR